MATRKLADLQKEATEARSRLLIGSWDAAHPDVAFRLVSLRELLKRPEDDEINRHVVVATVAALQTYLRGVVVALCNFDNTYRVRAAELLQEKISIKDALGWIGGASVSFGELVAHSATCNSTTDYITWMSALLAGNFHDQLKTAVPELDVRNKKQRPEPIIADVDLLFSRLSDLFRLRHILAHEAASGLQVRNSTVSEMHKCACLLIEGTDAVLWSTAYQSLPLTQTEMNIHAAQLATKAASAMDVELNIGLACASDSTITEWLTKHQAEWMRLCDDWYKNTYGSMQGTMWPSVAGVDRARVIEARTEQIRQWVRVIRPPENNGKQQYCGFGGSFDY
ncbi:hypothetical protein WN982_10835 [Paraburkholderia sp. IMGN_8]|uniref:hypothetical protein n=1 Tax=Paraburkholderia sp. IMGN_8 TaxID=3136564 RepID=UPI0031012F36